MLRRPPRSTLFPYTTLFRSRVPKTHPRIEAYGDVDELNSHIGVTLTLPDLPEAHAARLRRIQNELFDVGAEDRKSTRLNSSHSSISYAVFCLKKKKNT